MSNAAAHDPKENISQTVSFKDMVYGNPLRLPRLPIPSLEDTVSRYLQVCLDPDRMDERCIPGQGDGPVLVVLVVTNSKCVVGFVLDKVRYSICVQHSLTQFPVTVELKALL